MYMYVQAFSFDLPRSRWRIVKATNHKRWKKDKKKRNASIKPVPCFASVLNWKITEIRIEEIPETQVMVVRVWTVDEFMFYSFFFIIIISKAQIIIFVNISNLISRYKVLISYRYCHSGVIKTILCFTILHVGSYYFKLHDIECV